MLKLIEENPALSVFVAYILVISIISIAVCMYDKRISRKNRVELRVSEKNLFLLSALGGSLAMYTCMLLIRHKTKHLRFMLGLPLIFAAQAAIVYLLFHFGIF